MVSANFSQATSNTLLDITLTNIDDQQGVERIVPLKCQATKPLSEEFRRRVQVEWQFCNETGHAGAILELMRLGKEIQRLGHTLHVDGAAAGSAMLHLTGLTPLDPIEHGLLTERFVDVGRRLADYWPWGHSPIDEPDFFGARTSMSLQELMRVLRRRGYVFSTSATTPPGHSECILAEPRRGSDPKAVHLLVSESSTAVLANLLSPWERESSTNDIQTWHLLAAGDTAGIELLDSEVVQAALRRHRPKSLAELAGVLALTRLGSLSPDLSDAHGNAVYQEDLMQSLHASLGIGLRDAYELLRALSAPLAVDGDRVREAFFGVTPPSPLSPREWNQLWDRVVDEGPIAVCKAAYLTTAHDCLQAAYLKAHQPAVLRAALQVATA